MKRELKSELHQSLIRSNFRGGSLTRILLLAAGAAALLAACGGSQPPIAEPNAIPRGRAITTRVDRGVSWMAPEAKSENLLYISDYYGVHIFSYPKGQHVGDIDDFVSPAGLCSNQAGDVFVTDTPAYHVYEYAHGNTKRLRTLYDNRVDLNPIDCSVDPTTGNLAVAALDSAFVVIFPKAEEKPKVYYEDMSETHMSQCAYDNSGNLFVDQVAKGRKNYIGELPHGATEFTNYLLDPRIAPPGGIQFDGKHVAIEDIGSHVVYRLRFSGSEATVVGSTPLNGTTSVDQYSIHGKTLVGPDSHDTVYLWRYPRGGSPIRSFEGFTLNYGSTVSVSP